MFIGAGVPLYSALGLTSANPAEMFREYPTNDLIRLYENQKNHCDLVVCLQTFTKNGEKNGRGRRESDNTSKKR